MNGLEYYFWLAIQALQVLVLFPPAALLMFVGVIGTVASVQFLPPDRRRRATAAILIPMALPAAILLCGALLVHDTDLDSLAPRWPEWLIGGLLLAHLPVAGLLVWRVRGARWVALFSSMAVASYSCGAAFMSTMSVSGRWL